MPPSTPPHQPSRSRKWRVLLLVLAGFGVAAALVVVVFYCTSTWFGAGGVPATTAVPDPTATSEAEFAEPNTGEATNANGSEPEAVDTLIKPEVTVLGDAPLELLLEDLVVGDGEQVVGDATVTVDYVGVAWSTNEEFDSTWEAIGPSTLGTQDVIDGWTQGLQGMKVGGPRKITIPPNLGYGAEGMVDLVGPNETLVYVIDLREIE